MVCKVRQRRQQAPTEFQDLHEPLSEVQSLSGSHRFEIGHFYLDANTNVGAQIDWLKYLKSLTDAVVQVAYPRYC